MLADHKLGYWIALLFTHWRRILSNTCGVRRFRLSEHYHGSMPKQPCFVAFCCLLAQREGCDGVSCRVAQHHTNWTDSPIAFYHNTL